METTKRPLAASWRRREPAEIRRGTLAEFKARLEGVLEDKHLQQTYSRSVRGYLRNKATGNAWAECQCSMPVTPEMLN